MTSKVSTVNNKIWIKQISGGKKSNKKQELLSMLSEGLQVSVIQENNI